MSQDQLTQSFDGTWEKLSQVAVKGAEYDSRERQPHPKCLKGTRVDLLSYIHESLDNREKNQLIWLHGTAGVGKSAVAFTVAERMRGLKVNEQTNVERRLAGTFFFSRKHTERCTTGYFFTTLVYQLASNFPSIRADVNRAIRENPSLLDPNKSHRDQMEALFLKPLQKLRHRLNRCEPLTFVVDALDECTSNAELVDLILLLAQALRDPDLPVTHILLTSRSEPHIRNAFQNEEVRPLVEIPVKMSGDGVASIISLDGADVDKDIYIFLQHSFTELASRHPDFPQPMRDELKRLASRAGRRFIVASTMMKFIDDQDQDPRDRLQLMLELTSKLLPGTEVHRLYDSILSTCSDPKRAYQHLSVVAALANPLPMSQISKLLGPGSGRDVETVLMQLRSVVNIPSDGILPVNIYHSSVRDYVSDPSNSSLPKVHDIPSPHSLLAHSSFCLMMREIPESTALLDALSELNRHSQATQPHDPLRLKDSLAFVVEPPGPLSALIIILWLRGDRRSDLRFWLETLNGYAWLETQGGKDWLETYGGELWLETKSGQDWLENEGGQNWLRTQGGRDWLEMWGGLDWLETQRGLDWLQTEGGRDWLQTRGGGRWLETGGQDWLQSQEGRDWLEMKGGRDWLQTLGGRLWLETGGGRHWLQMQGGRHWLQTVAVRGWLETGGGQLWLETGGGRRWLQTQGGQGWLQTLAVGGWLETEGGRRWLQTWGGRHWLRNQGRRNQLITEIQAEGEGRTREGGGTWNEGGETWNEGGEIWTKDDLLPVQTPGWRNWLQTPHGRDWLQTPRGRAWLQTWLGRDWLQTQGGRDWLKTQGGRDWLQAQGGQDWLQTQDARNWLQTQGGCRLRTHETGYRRPTVKHGSPLL